MTEKTQKQQIEEIIELAVRELENTRQNEPVRKFSWWGTGAFLNGEEIGKWKADCAGLETSLEKSKEFLSKHGEYSEQTISQVSHAFDYAMQLRYKYCERRY